jgi:hypothetical protein
VNFDTRRYEFIMAQFLLLADAAPRSLKFEKHYPASTGVKAVWETAPAGLDYLLDHPPLLSRSITVLALDLGLGLLAAQTAHNSASSYPTKPFFLYSGDQTTGKQANRHPPAPLASH